MAARKSAGSLCLPVRSPLAEAGGALLEVVDLVMELFYDSIAKK